MTGDKSRPRRSQSARDQRIELYVQATIIITTSNHSYSRDGGYTGETERLMNHRRVGRPRQQPQDWQQRRPQQQHHLHDRDLHHHHQQLTPEATTGGLRARSTPLPSLPRDFFSPVVSIHPVSLGASHHRHIQLQRHCGVSSGTHLGSKTQILPVLHTVNRQTTQRPIVQLVTGDQDPARASSVNSQESTNRRPVSQMTSAPFPSTELTGRPSWGRKQLVHGHIQFGQRSPRGSLVTGDKCSPEDSGSTPVEGDMNMNFDYAVGKCGDQGDRDRSGLTLWQVSRPRRQR